MIECYYSKCAYNYKTEPFCCEEECLATSKELQEWQHERRKKLLSPKRKFSLYEIIFNGVCVGCGIYFLSKGELALTVYAVLLLATNLVIMNYKSK